MHGGGMRANGYAARQNGRCVWLYNQLPCHRISDFFEGSNRGVPLIARPGMQYSFPYLREFIFIYIYIKNKIKLELNRNIKKLIKMTKAHNKSTKIEEEKTKPENNS